MFRSHRVSQQQKQMLLDIMEEKFDFLFGKNRTSVSIQRRKHEWLVIAQRLNTCGPAQKTVKEWKVCFSNLRTRVQGIQPNAEHQNDFDQRIMRICGLAGQSATPSSSAGSAGNSAFDDDDDDDDVVEVSFNAAAGSGFQQYSDQQMGYSTFKPGHIKMEMNSASPTNVGLKRKHEDSEDTEHFRIPSGTNIRLVSTPDLSNHFPVPDHISYSPEPHHSPVKGDRDVSVSRNQRVSQQQKKLLLDIMQDKFIALYSRLPGSLSMMERISEWEAITVRLNRCGPARKTHKEWKICFGNLKTRVKDRMIANEPLSDMDNRIVHICRMDDTQPPDYYEPRRSQRPSTSENHQQQQQQQQHSDEDGDNYGEKNFEFVAAACSAELLEKPRNPKPARNVGFSVNVDEEEEDEEDSESDDDDSRQIVDVVGSGGKMPSKAQSRNAVAAVADDSEAESNGATGSEKRSGKRHRNEVTAARLRKIYDGIAQQAEQHASQMQRDHELHELRLSHERERHAQQMAQQREWHEHRLRQQGQDRKTSNGECCSPAAMESSAVNLC